MRNIILISLLLVAAGSPPPLPPAPVKHAKKLILPPIVSKLDIPKTPVPSTITNILPILFTNTVRFGYSTNIVALDLLWYTDDNGLTWHHFPAQPWISNSIIAIDTNAPNYRLYLDTYTAGNIKP